MKSFSIVLCVAIALASAGCGFRRPAPHATVIIPPDADMPVIVSRR